MRDSCFQVKVFLIAVTALALGGCAAESEGGAAAPLRGFGIEVDAAVAPRVPTVHLTTCGSWGCHEQDVPLHVSGPTSALPCPSSSGPDAACGVVRRSGSGHGFGYAPIPKLTLDPVTVTVTTPTGAPFPITAELSVRPRAVCPGGPGESAEGNDGPTDCANAVPQAKLRITADGTVEQSR